MTARVSVVVPAHAAGDDLSRCLEALSRAIGVGDELIVVNDGGGEEVTAAAVAHATSVLSHPEPLGPASARNRGARAARGEVILFIDADVVVPSDLVDRVRSRLDSDPSLDAVIGSYDDSPAASQFLSQYRNLFHHFNHQQGSPEASTFWGACGGIRREVFWSVGGFDEWYVEPSVEDIELGYRLTARGHRIRLCSELQVKHLKRWGVRSMIFTDVFRRGIPWTELLLHHRDAPRDLNVGPSGRLGVVAAYLLVVLLGGALWEPTLLAGAAVAGGGLTALNWPFYRFLQERRGSRFLLRALPWHTLYHLYCGAAFAAGAVRYALRDRVGPFPPPEPAGS